MSSLNFKLISEEIKLQRPIRFPANTFSDVLALKGLSLGAGTWDRDAKDMVLSGIFTPKDLIAFQEDVFCYFLEHGYTEDEAWLASKDVVLGRGVRNSELLGNKLPSFLLHPLLLNCYLKVNS